MSVKHPRRKPETPNSQVKNVLRMLWLRSRERAAALKRDGNKCCVCGVKASVAKGREVKIEVHHVDGIDWDGIVATIKSRVLQTPDKFICLCKECHSKEHTCASTPASQTQPELPI